MDVTGKIFQIHVGIIQAHCQVFEIGGNIFTDIQPGLALNTRKMFNCITGISLLGQCDFGISNQKTPDFNLNARKKI